jgi:hypothetical protein
MWPIVLSCVTCPAVQGFSTLSHKRHDVREMLLNIKLLFLRTVQLFSQTLLIPRRFQRDIVNTCGSSCKVCYSSQILIKIEFSRCIFEQKPNIEFHENPFNGSRVVSCGQRDGQTVDSYGKITEFSQFCRSA